jgi:hypothetical protein
METSRWQNRRGVLFAAATAAAAVVVAGLTAGPADASTSPPTATEYALTGTTHIRMAHANMALPGPGSLETLSVPGDPNFYGGRLTLTPTLSSASTTTLSFTEGGNAVTATIHIAQVGPLTGSVSTDGTVTVNTQQTLTVTSLSVAGQSVAVGTACQSIKPFSLNATSTDGFSLTDGGTLTARYAITPFANCGLQGDTVLNGGIPGPSNTASLSLGPATNSAPGFANNTILAGQYPFNGTTTIHRSGAVVTLGPGTLYALVSLEDGAVSGGDLALPPGTGTATLHGKTVSLTAAFIQDGPISGNLNLQTGAVTSTARETLQVTNLTVNGQSIPVPATCQTVKPVVIHAATTSGFNVLRGGTLEAPSYYIPPFANCGSARPFVNKALPGAGNKLDLTLGSLTTFP